MPSESLCFLSSRRLSEKTCFPSPTNIIPQQIRRQADPGLFVLSLPFFPPKLSTKVQMSLYCPFVFFSFFPKTRTALKPLCPTAPCVKVVPFGVPGSSLLVKQRLTVIFASVRAPSPSEEGRGPRSMFVPSACSISQWLSLAPCSPLDLTPETSPLVYFFIPPSFELFTLSSLPGSHALVSESFFPDFPYPPPQR